MAGRLGGWAGGRRVACRAPHPHETEKCIQYINYPSTSPHLVKGGCHEQASRELTSGLSHGIRGTCQPCRLWQPCSACCVSFGNRPRQVVPSMSVILLCRVVRASSCLSCVGGVLWRCCFFALCVHVLTMYRHGRGHPDVIFIYIYCFAPTPHEAPSCKIIK